MRFRIFWIVVAAFFAHPMFAQDADSTKQSFWDKVYISPNIGFQAGNQAIFVLISPIVGYRLTDKFSVGPGATWSYFENRQSAIKLSYTAIGYKAFARYIVVPQAFAHAEYENLGYKLDDGSGSPKQTEWFSATFLGGGVSQSLGRRSSLMVMVLYNVTWSTNQRSLYSSPWVTRVGFQF